MTRSVRFALCAATALLWWLAGAFGLFPLGWIALAPCFYLVKDLPARSRLRWGYLTGFCSFFLINWWLLPTITHGAPAIGAAPALGALLSLVAVTFIALVHGLQPALAALLWNDKGRIFSRCRPLMPLAVALSWAALDWLRCWGPLAHSWGALAFSQTGDLPLLQSAFWIGRHGLSALCVGCSASLAHALAQRDRRPLMAMVALLGILHGAGWLRLNEADDARAQAKHTEIMAVQTDVGSLRKRGFQAGEGPFTQAFRLTVGAAGKPDLVIWPETTANFTKSHLRGYSGLQWEQWRRSGVPVPLLSGAQVEDEEGRDLNEAVLIGRDGTAQSSAKKRLVPFGERAPFSEFLPFLELFAPRPALVPGREPRVLTLGGHKLGTLICFESCFDRPARDLANQGAEFLAILTNDEWFAGTEAPRQHAAMATLIAVETGLPVVQAANGGYSFVVDRQGRVVVSTKFGEARILRVTLP